MKYSYQAEKFSAARRALMLPHTEGEAMSVDDAFNECALGLHRLSENGLSDNSRMWIEQLQAFMDTSSIQDPSGRGAWLVKAEQFSNDDLLEISRIIDELASWFDDYDRDR